MAPNIKKTADAPIIIPAADQLQLVYHREEHPQYEEASNMPAITQNIAERNHLTVNDALRPEHSIDRNTTERNRLSIRNAEQLRQNNGGAAPANPATNQMEIVELLLRTLSHRQPLPEFFGMEHEDPRVYLQRCDTFLTASFIQRDLRLTNIEKGLKGEALKWWEGYRGLNFEYEQFQELLLAKYDNHVVRNNLLAQLYSTRQTEKEITAVFIQKKLQLYQRLRPEEAEEIKIQMILGLMRPSLRRAIRPNAPQTHAQLLVHAAEAEQDEEEERKATPKATPAARPKTE